MRSRGRKPLRTAAVLAVIVLVAGVFAIRLVDIQMVSAAALNAEAEGKRAVPVTIPSLRGDIIDRNGAVLATTDERFDVQLSPKNTRVHEGRFWRANSDPDLPPVEVTSEQAFAEIAAITGQEAADIQKIVDDALADNPKSDFAYVKRGVDLTTLNQLKALGVPWLTFASNHTRTYPNGAVGGNLIGFAGADEVPLAGVELSQNTCLTGVDGEESYERGADGVALPGSVVVTQPVVDGGTVALTIDRDLQWEAQQAINAQTAWAGAEWGLLTVMDARTGELVAVAEDGSVDPGNIDGSDPNKREARSFVAPYEPGSTFKTITTAALIDQGQATAGTPNLTPWTWEPEPGVRFQDSASHEPTNWTLAGIMMRSSNVGISMLGSRLDPQTRYDYLRAFGIGESTAAGLPLEDSGLLYPADEWDRQTSYNTMFGQGVSSTIVQTAGVYQTIANGGLRIPPSLVVSCTASDGSVSTPDHGDPVQVVAPETAASVLDILETVVNESWVQPYVSIPGYRIAGKTGTAEQTDGQGGYRSDFVHSFVGVFPVDDPQFVIAASIAYPSYGDAGAIGAMTAFRMAAEATIRALHVPPSTGSYTALPLTD